MSRSISHYFLILQWKSFLRSPSFATNLWFKILQIILVLYFVVVLLALGFGAYYIIEEFYKSDPLQVVNGFMIYGVGFWIVYRFFLQKMPVLNVQPFMMLPVSKSTLVHLALGASSFSFFNWINAFFFIPFSVVLCMKGYPFFQVLSWHFGIMGLVYFTNYLNLLINNKNIFFYGTLVLMLGFFAIDKWTSWSLVAQSGLIFEAFYDQPYMAIWPWGLTILAYFGAFRHFKKALYLDGLLQKTHTSVREYNLTWLNRFGQMTPFLKNDLRLILRNKRSRTTVIVSILFLFYGLLFFSENLAAYESPIWKIFAGIFVSGGFLFTFGQYVPSWDSAYYPFLMSQNIHYKEYLQSKWLLIVVATVVSLVIGTFYLYFGLGAYLAVLAGALYNIGVNSYLVLWGGAYIKTPIDLNSNKKAFGDKQAFNSKTLLLTIPKLVLPVLVYAAGHYLLGVYWGYFFVATLGLAGLFFKGAVFKKIEGLYKKQKYSTLAAYKTKF